ncbi:hypothetical protein I5F83_29070, partial [Pseudomonas aeruginosa]|nr:hypothetical protein [Pseudomonas aeruginosa]
MSGLPVSHVGEKVSGGVISTGSPTVHVGSSAVGLADRVSALSRIHISAPTRPRDRGGGGVGGDKKGGGGGGGGG